MKHNLAKIYLVIVAIIWGTGFLATALAIDFYTPAQILALRFTIAFVVLAAVYHQEIRTTTKKEFIHGSIVGLFLYVAFIFQTVGLQYTTVSKNAFLTAVNIVLVPLISALILGKKIKIEIWLGVIITLLGIGVLSLTDSLVEINLGDILTLVCALFFALQIIATDRFSKEMSTVKLMAIQMGVAGLLSWITVGVTGETSLNLSSEALLPVIYLGLVSTLIAYYLQTYAQKFTSGTETAVILSTESIFGMLGSVIFLGEKVTTSLLIGAVLIFMGILTVEGAFNILKNKSIS